MHPNDPADLLGAVRDLEPSVRAAAAESDGSRRLPLTLVQAMHRAGLFRMCLPPDLGGSECEPLTVFRVIEAVAHIDGSAGWIVLVNATTPGCIVPFLREDVARELFLSDPDAITGGVLAPLGKALAVAGGYRVSGRWPFASGCEHCAWLVAGCVVHDGDEPRRRPDGTPVARMLVLPAAACQIHDTWDVQGLRGSGSHDFSVGEVFVPEVRSVSPFEDTRRLPQPHYAIGFLNVAHAAHALGVARHALDALAAFACDASARRQPVRERPLAQARLAQAEALAGAARAYVLSAIEDTWQTACDAGAASQEQRLLLRLAIIHAVQSAARAVDLVYDAAGGWAIYTRNPLERCWRDIHTATQHAVAATPSYEAIGRSLLSGASAR